MAKRRAKGKEQRAHSFQAVRAETILVGGAQSLKVRLLWIDGLTPAALPSTGKLMTARFTVFDLCTG